MMAWGIWVFWKRTEQEEEMMAGKFGQEWDRYKRRTWLWIPWIV
jgi:protein-S-isoprenylcysteine O-methyltransferase Ste14